MIDFKKVSTDNSDLRWSETSKAAGIALAAFFARGPE